MFVRVVPMGPRRLARLKPSRTVVRNIEEIWECAHEVLRPFARAIIFLSASNRDSGGGKPFFLACCGSFYVVPVDHLHLQVSVIFRYIDHFCGILPESKILLKVPVQSGCFTWGSTSTRTLSPTPSGLVCVPWKWILAVLEP